VEQRVVDGKAHYYAVAKVQCMGKPTASLKASYQHHTDISSTIKTCSGNLPDCYEHEKQNRKTQKTDLFASNAHH